jgi:hypothetical protein
MKLVMTLMVRNEADIIDTQIAFHLAAGVDFIIATDHDSSDETTAILESYEQRGVLHLIRVSSATKRKSERVTRMARSAAADFGADWVINSDADEFWWPSGGNLKEVLAHIPDRYGVVRTFVRPFLPRPGEDQFVERMTVRLAPSAPINNPFGPFRVNVRLIHRAASDIVVGGGNASVRSQFLPLRGLLPTEVFHYPIRSFGQFKRKFLTHYETSSGERRRGEHVRAYAALQAGTLDELYDELVVDDLRVERGLEAGSLAIDTRMRDALRALAVAPSSFRFPRRSTIDDVGYAVDSAVLDDGELVRLQRRVDDLRAKARTLGNRHSWVSNRGTY